MKIAPMLLVVLVACGSSKPEPEPPPVETTTAAAETKAPVAETKAPPAETKAPSSEVKAPAKACVAINPGRDLDADASSVTLEGSVLGFCRMNEEGEPLCFDYDVAKDTLSSRAVPKAAGEEPDYNPFPAGLVYDDAAGSLSWCASKPCTPLPLPKGLRPMGASLSADGKRVAVSATKDGEFPTEGFVFAAGGALERKLNLIWNKDYECGAATFLGDELVVFQDVCAGPAGIGWLPDAKGKPRAFIGGDKAFDAFPGAAVHLGGTRWAVRETNGALVAIQDLATGKVEHMISVRHTLPTNDEGEPFLEPEAGFIVGGPGEPLVVMADIRTFVVLDADKGKIAKILHPPLCEL